MRYPSYIFRFETLFTPMEYERIACHMLRIVEMLSGRSLHERDEKPSRGDQKNVGTGILFYASSLPSRNFVNKIQNIFVLDTVSRHSFKLLTEPSKFIQLVALTFTYLHAENVVQRFSTEKCNFVELKKIILYINVQVWNIKVKYFDFFFFKYSSLWHFQETNEKYLTRAYVSKKKRMNFYESNF